MRENFIRKNLLKLPIKVLTFYLLATILMFAISPWDWKILNYFSFYLFNGSVIIALILGYKSALSKYKYYASNKININNWINRSIIIGILAMYPRFLVFHSVSYISLSNIFNKIILGILLPAQAYSEKYLGGDMTYNTLSNPIALLNLISVPFIYFIIFLGFYYWEKLSKWQKAGYTLILISHIFLYISIGTNKGLFDLVIVFPFLFVAKNPDLIRLTKKQITIKRFFLIAFSIILISSVIGFFAKGNKERKSDYFYQNTAMGTVVNHDAAILKIIPENIKDGYLSLDSYLTQGYYALSLALDMEFMPCYGFGNSFFFTSLGEKVVGEKVISDRTYQHRIEEQYGYSHYGKWHSMYVWFANDISFWLVPFLCYFIGYFFATSWMDILLHKNIYAVIVFSLLLIMIFYFPANNQILGFQGSAMTLIVFFILWQKSRKKNYLLW